MKKSAFSAFRILGALLGLLFLAMVPFAAAEKGLTSVNGIAFMVLGLVLGLIFAVYGFTGMVNLPKLPPRFRGLQKVLMALLEVTFGLYLLTGPDHGTFSHMFGAFALFFGVLTFLETGSKRDATPTA